MAGLQKTNDEKKKGVQQKCHNSIGSEFFTNLEKKNSF